MLEHQRLRVPESVMRERRIADGLAAIAGDSWSKHFGRSRLGVNVFYCRIDWIDEWLKLQKYPGTSTIMLFGPTHRAHAFADGGYFARWQSFSFGIGGLHGQWVVGFAALRHLCDQLDLVPPVRLKGEAAVPDPRLLRYEVERQMRLERDNMIARVRLLMTPQTLRHYWPEEIWTHVLGSRPMIGLDEAATAMVLGATSWEFLSRVVLPQEDPPDLDECWWDVDECWWDDDD